MYVLVPVPFLIGRGGRTDTIINIYPIISMSQFIIFTRLIIFRAS